MVCRLLLGGFGLAYLMALVLLVIGTFGLFGNERDPLSGVFLLPLGLPWNLAAGRLPDGLLRVAGAVVAPLINLTLLFAVCRAFQKS
jgi:hypothetical protein